MLVLSRKRDEAIEIGENVRLFVLEIRGDKVRLGIEAPEDVIIHRAEVAAAIRRARANVDADSSGPIHIEN